MRLRSHTFRSCSRAHARTSNWSGPGAPPVLDATVATPPRPTRHIAPRPITPMATGPALTPPRHKAMTAASTTWPGSGTRSDWAAGLIQSDATGVGAIFRHIR